MWRRRRGRERISLAKATGKIGQFGSQSGLEGQEDQDEEGRTEAGEGEGPRLEKMEVHFLAD